LSVGRDVAGPLLLETIRIEEGKPRHLFWHEERMNRSRRELFGAEEPLRLERYLTGIPSSGLWRCRVLYRQGIEKVETLPYKGKVFRHFALVEFTGEYAYKYADRRNFERLLAEHPDVDDLILCRNGMLTDTTIANLALKIDGRWLTPAAPLLRGTTRARLLSEGRLEEAPLPCAMLERAEELALMNAMLGFHTVGRPSCPARTLTLAP
jgi:4-amino-4-deoxychorismate lyase